MKTKSETYCQAMAEYFGSNGKPLANLVMSISSYTNAKSIVEYSESPLYYYQYSSISKLFARLLVSVGNDTKKFEQQVQLFIKDFVPMHTIIRTQLDVFPVYKPLSATLADRSAVYRPNVKLEGQKPVEIGYNISSFNQGFEQKWCIPHSMQRVKSHERAINVGIDQIKNYLKSLPNNHPLVVNVADSSYGNAEFISSLNAEKLLVNIIRFKNRNVYDYAPETNTGGANRIYGQVYNLSKIGAVSHRKNPKSKELVAPKPSIETKNSDQIACYLTQTSKGRQIKVTLKLYTKMAIRSKNGFSMKDKPFDLVVVEHLDAQSLEPIHQKPIYLAVCGHQKQEVTLTQAYQDHYQHRYDIEPNNRFVKHQLLLDKFQTCVQAHFDIWLSVIQLTEWLLFVAHDEVQNQPKKWQSYLPENQNNNARKLTITQTRKGCQPFF
jgi:hypothetical protein